MELARMSNQDRLKLCRRYFYIGFFGLPFLWMINTVWFGMFIFKYDTYQEQRRQQQQRSNRTNRQTINPQQQTSPQEPMIVTSPEQSNTSTQDDRSARNQETTKHLLQIRSLVIYSFCGSMIWIVSILAWIITFQLKRAEWGEWGDEISFNIPRGIP